ncbi:MarR family transcriptional regulator [Hoeflea sp. AS16]|uniref:MarR family winged helix-turn-helix transcriptional regulator n=1 Tax=unclassified Hoeflea TaxID=2614931 RepID=UPI003173884B
MNFDHLRNVSYGPAEVFAYFSEACQTAQLSEALLDKCLPDDLHRSHFYIINHLVRGGDGETPLQITEAMQVTKTTISHSLAVLEARGFIQTRPSPSDARSKQVFVTEAGRDFQKRAVTALTGLYGSFLREEDYRTMGDALPSLVSVRKLLEKNSGAMPE